MTRSEEHPLLVAIDGPAGSGKGTVARRVADELGIPYYDTGAMYRALALAVLERGEDPEDRPAVERVLEEVEVELRVPEEGSRVEVILDGEPVEDRIRTPRVGQATSRVAVHPPVRRFMVELQRRWGRRLGGVMEGRDIGTRVFPDAPVKIFLDASPEVRAERRYRQLREAGQDVAPADALADVRRRDLRDTTREDSPLRCDETYIRVDTTDLGVDRVVERVLEAVRQARSGRDRSGGRPGKER